MSDHTVSVVVGDAEVPGESPIHRCNLISDELISIPFPNEPEVKTLWHCMVRSAKKYADCNFLGHRPIKPDGTAEDYVWQTYGQAFPDIVNIGKGLTDVCKLDSGSNQGEKQARVGIYSQNRPECTKCLIGAFSQQFIACPLYDALGASAAGYIIEHAEISTVFVERKKLASLLDSKKGKSPLKYVVLFEEPTEEEKKQATGCGCTLFSLKEVIEAGRSSSVADSTGAGPTPEHWAYIMYTSGTTGDPKGVILTHKNLISSASGLLRGMSEEFVNSSDVYISYLPMAHSFEVMLQVDLIAVGASIGFFQGDPKKLVTEDLPTLRPTCMAGVPRVYSRVYDKVMQGLEKKGKVAQTLFNIAFNNQSWCMQYGFRNPLWDLILFSKVREALGGRVRILASGAAPLSADLHRFLRVVFGCPVLQGYGLTENCAAAMAQQLTYSGAGNVGGPLPCTEVKLVDTEDYTSKDVYPATVEEFEKQVSFKGEFDPKLAGKNVQRGEVWLRGSNIFVGYYKMPDITKETKTDDGWLKTGDIGMWLEDGALAIIDRKKNIFKLSQGEYVAPEAIEGAIGASKWVMQVWVYGNSEENCVVAVVVPDSEVLLPWAEAEGKGTTLAEVCSREEVKKMVFDDMVACGKAAKLRGFELPKDILFETEVNALGQGFTVENDLLTPTFKPRRPQLGKKYSKAIDRLYADLRARDLAG